ncbi:MAG: transposase [Rhodopila sp.]
MSVWKDELKNQRNAYEDTCLRRLAELVPPGYRVTILADRGFGDQKLFAFLDKLGFGYVIRFRGNIHVTAADGLSKPAAEWIGKGGRARKLPDARVTAKGQRSAPRWRTSRHGPTVEVEHQQDADALAVPADLHAVMSVFNQTVRKFAPVVTRDEAGLQMDTTGSW